MNIIQLYDKERLFTERTLFGVDATLTIGGNTTSANTTANDDVPINIDRSPETEPKNISEKKLKWHVVFVYFMIALFLVLYLWSKWADRRTNRKHAEEAEERLERRIEYIKNHMTIAVSFLISIAHNVCPNSCRINAFILIEVSHSKSTTIFDRSRH